MAAMAETWARRRSLTFGLLAVALVAIGSALGQLATFPNLAPWYAGLAKPSFKPPNFIFGPVWTALGAKPSSAGSRTASASASRPVER